MRGVWIRAEATIIWVGVEVGRLRNSPYPSMGTNGDETR